MKPLAIKHTPQQTTHPHFTNKNRLLERRLHALASNTTTTLTPPPTQSQPQETTTLQDSDFVTPEEIENLLPDQIAFLVRKRKAARGLGPIMPESSICSTCTGIGSLICHQCNGSGRNATDKAEEIFDDERGIQQNNGLVNARFLFIQNGPCWLCRGQQQVACKDCSGTGIAGGVDRFTGD